MDAAVNAGTASQGNNIKKYLEYAVIAIVSVLLVLGTSKYAQGLISQQKTSILLSDQVDELSARTSAMMAYKMNRVPADALPASPVVTKLAVRLGMERLPAESVRDMLEKTKTLAQSTIHRYRNSGAPKDPLIPDGLTWQGERLVNQWGGDVALFMRADGFVMVSFTRVPVNACEGLRLGRASAYRDYLFACNDTLLVAEAGGSVWQADIEKLLAVKAPQP